MPDKNTLKPITTIALIAGALLVFGLLWHFSAKDHTASTPGAPAQTTGTDTGSGKGGSLLENPDAPKVVLQPASGQLNLYNKGSVNLEIWGSKFSTMPADMGEPRALPASTEGNNFYFFPTAELEKIAVQIIGPDGEKQAPFEVYISDKMDHYYIARFALLLTVANSKVTIQAQQVAMVQVKDKTFAE